VRWLSDRGSSLYIVMLSLSAGCGAGTPVGALSVALGDEHRIIIQAPDVDELGRELHRLNIPVVKGLAFHGGFVIRASESAAASLSGKLGGSYEKDVLYALPGAQAKGGGAPPPPPPAQVIPWGISKIRARDAATRGAGITVCVSDTGIDLSHPDLKANIVGSVNTISPTKSATDDNGHGTHVAGIIAAVDNTMGVVGVAPLAKLIAAKGLSRSGTGWASDLAETIDECRVRGAHIINMSWGSSTPTGVIGDAIVRAASAGVLLIGAAGNESGPVIYPAAYPQVVAVSAVDINDAFASFSNFGSEVENSAPGVNIYSTWKGGGYATISGTSMAAPHVAGVAALMLSIFPAETRDGLAGIDLGLSIDRQGSRGRIDAVLSTQ